MKYPAIVVNAFERPEALRRLLDSISRATIPNDVQLVISIEYGAPQQVVGLAENFPWPFGKKEIIQHKAKLGLVGHFLACGALSKTYESIIYLEDDLFVGNGFYTYSVDILRYYQGEERIAGFSLNSLWFNGFTHAPFKPVDDGNPIFFLQIPWYQGQIYTANQWRHFEKWYSKNPSLPSNSGLHESFLKFPEEEWFPIVTQYLVDTGKFYCFPRISHCVNFGDAGTHFKLKTNFFQTELATGYSGGTFRPFQDSDAQYDSYFELSPEKLKKLNSELREYDFTVDLNGTKRIDIILTPFVITSKESSHPIKSFALEMKPPEQNVIQNIPGDAFRLCETVSLKSAHSKSIDWFNYHYRFKLGKKQSLKVALSLLKSLFRE